MITRNLPVRGHADDVTLTSAPPRRTARPIELPKPPITLFGLPLIAFLAVIGVSVVVVACGLIVAAKVVEAAGYSR